MDNKEICNNTESSLCNGSMIFDTPLTTGFPGDKLLRVIVNDVTKSVPRNALASLEALVEYSNHYSSGDGLLRAFFDSTFDKSVHKHMYLISLTTIWIALFTRPIDAKKLQANRLNKAKREFQICMLYYCFGLLSGQIPAKGARFVKKQRFRWETAISNADDDWCVKYAIELMGLFGLEYNQTAEHVLLPSLNKEEKAFETTGN